MIHDEIKQEKPPIRLLSPAVSRAGIEAASAVLSSGWLGYGAHCHKLENGFCEARGGWALATQSCTAALWAVAMLIGANDQPEIIIPANTYVACAAAFHIAGWRVRVCDIDPETGLLDLADAQRHLTARTRALLVVDIYGQRFPEHLARQFCDDRRLFLVRDAAHRLDVDQAKSPEADFVCYSFGPTKEVPCPDGGLLWSRRHEYDAPARAITYWGIKDTWTRTSSSIHTVVMASQSLGLKLRQTDVNAAMVSTHLEHWPSQREQRRATVARYQAALKDKTAYMIPRRADDSCLMAPVLVAPAARAAVRARLADHGVSSSDHYPNIITMMPGQHKACPAADEFCASVIALPMHLYLTTDDVARIASVL